MTQAERLALPSSSDIAKYNLGSILSGGGSTPSQNTPAGWQDMITGYQTAAMGTRLQIPIVYGADVVHGHNNVTGAVLFPHNVGIGAAHDPSLGVSEGAVSAAEMKATGVPWAFSPCLCVSRDERWGRAYESYGEDPAVVIANEDVIDGFQDNGTLATAKHFVGDGGTTYGSSTTGNYKIDQGVTPPSELATLHLPPFDAAVKQHHVGSVMPSFLSNVCDSAAALRARARCASVPKFDCVAGSGNGCSNSPSRNFSRRIRLTASSTRVSGTAPDPTALVSDVSNAWYSYGVITMSMPALIDVTTWLS
jgi:beta-glucosidase